MLKSFCQTLTTAVADAVAKGITTGTARGFALVTGETFELPAIEVDAKKKIPRKKQA